MNTGKRRHLLCYDIACPKRLAKVHKRVKKDGLALQYSVYELTLTHSELQSLINDLNEIIHQKFDDVRIYGLLPESDTISIGKPTMPEGILFFNNP
jgi:CRISPR-associated protein Cas2